MEKSSKSDPNEPFLDALSDEPTQLTTKTSFDTAKESSKTKNVKSKSKLETSSVVESHLTINEVETKIATVDTKALGKSEISTVRDDDSLIEFERQKISNVAQEKENIENTDKTKSNVSKTKRKQKGSESSEKEDDSLIEYEKRKSKPTRTSPESKCKKASPEDNFDLESKCDGKRCSNFNWSIP